MSFTVTSAKVTGNPDSSGWSQAFDFKPQDTEKLTRRGHLFALISTPSQKDDLDTVVAGREVFSRLHEEYFGKLEDTPFVALKDAVEKVIDEFSSWGGIEIAALTLNDENVFITVGGGTSVYLYRRNNLLRLVESDLNRVIAASGTPSDADMMLIGTKAFFESFPHTTIEDALKNYDPRLAIESFAPTLHSGESEGNLGVIVLRFDKYDKTSETEEIISLIGKDENIAEGLREQHLEDPKNKFGGIKHGILNLFSKGKNKEVYLKEGRSELPTGRKKTPLVVGILLLFILTVSIYFGVRQKRKSDFKSTYEAELASAEHELQESYNLYLLNPQRSRELFNQARNRVSSLSSREIEDPNLDSLYQKIKEGEERILGQYSSEAQPFVDLGLFSEGFRADSVCESNETAYVLDKFGKKIVSINLVNKRTEIFAGPSGVQDADSITAYSGRVFVSDPEGLYELDEGRVKVADSEWGNILLGAYAGNLYVLDKDASKIYRYPATNTGFGSKKEWLSVGVDVNLSGARNIVIDGMVWVITDGAQIYKFSLGNLLNFEFAGVFPGIENITDIFTNEENENLYILEKDKGRVVVTDKDGEYKAQYLAEGIKEANKLVVSEKEKKAFLLTSDKFLFFELRYLD